MELRDLIEKLNGEKQERDRKANPVRMSKAAEVWYRKQLLEVVAQLKDAAISAFSDSKFADEITPEEQIILNRKLSTATDKMRAINIDQLAMRISRSFVSRAFRINEKRTAEEYQSIFGVDVTRLPGGDAIRQQVEVSLMENVNLIKSIQNDFINDIGKHVRDRLYAGERSTGMIQLIHERGDVTVNRAKFIARDQTAKLNADLNEARNKDLGIDLYIWGGTGDARERESHSVMNGKLCKYSDPTVYSDDMGKTWKKRKRIGGVELHPGKDYQCFPFNSEINNVSFPSKVYRHNFSGEMFSISLANGNVITCTANHPVLTDNGIKPAKLISKSDNVICEMDQGFNAINFNGKNLVPKIGEIYNSLLLGGLDPVVSTSKGGEFHGDISNGEINVICIYSLLESKFDVIRQKVISELNFSKADMIICHEILSGNGDVPPVLDGEWPSLGECVSRFNLVASLLKSHFTPLELFCLALSTNRNGVLVKYSPDNISGNPEMLSNRVFAFSLLVHGNDFIDWKMDLITRGGNAILSHEHSKSLELLGQSVRVNIKNGSHLLGSHSGHVEPVGVIDVNSTYSSLHVFNLETESGYFISNKAVVSNCRCVSRPYIKWD